MDHGIVLTTANFKWAKQGDNAWASQAIERNGKWYWYVAAEDTTKHLHGIGVAVADHPEGTWTDALGKPLIPGDWGFIDPTVFVDDDGQAWLFWGNNGCWYAKLNEDMISMDKSFANNGICDMLRQSSLFAEMQPIFASFVAKLPIISVISLSLCQELRIIRIWRWVT